MLSCRRRGDLRQRHGRASPGLAARWLHRLLAFSQGAVIWVYLSEVFPNLVRAKGQSLGSFTHWIMNAMISAVFPGLAAMSRPAPFAVFAAITVVQFFVVLFVFPETAGVTLEDMQKKIASGRHGYFRDRLKRCA